MSRIKKIIQNIDPATKDYGCIDHAQLAMQPAPATGNQQTPASQGGEAVPVDARFREPMRPVDWNRGCSNAIHHQVNGYTSLRGPNQGRRHPFSGSIKTEDVGFQAHFQRAAVDRIDQRREKCGSAFQQVQLMTWPGLREGH